MAFPINISALTDGTHIGLTAASIVLTFPMHVFNFPTGNNIATVDVGLGNIPLSDTAGAGAAADWNLAANSATDGVLVVNLFTKVGDEIKADSFPGGGTLVTVNFPILPDATPGNETIKVVFSNGPAHTSVVGNNGTYILSPATGTMATGTITVTAGSQLSPIAPTTPVLFTTSAGETLNQAAPGFLAGTTDPNTPPEPLSVASINGSAANVGTTVTLPSGALLTAQADGSFVYVPSTSEAGPDSFTFQAIDLGGSLSNTGTVTVNVEPTLRVVPKSIASGPPGTVIEEDVYLDNPNPPGGAGPLVSFQVMLTYDPTVLAKSSAVSSVKMTYGGSGYTSPPAVTFTGGGGTGAAGTAVIDPGTGQVTSVVMTSAGSGYTSAPSVIFTGGGGKAAQGIAALVVQEMPGPVVPADWSFVVNPATGIADLSAFTSGAAGDEITGPAPIELAAFDFVITGNGSQSTPIELVAKATSSPGRTEIGGEAGDFPIYPQLGPQASAFLPGVDTLIGIQGAPLALSPVPPFDGNISLAYNQTIAVSGGTLPYSFALAGGTLPPGLTLSAKGGLAGTPTAAGSYPFSVRVTDAAGSMTSQSYTLTINPNAPVTFSPISIVAPFDYNGYGLTGLAEDTSGNLFGTTRIGTVFELPQGSATLTTLAVFQGSSGGEPNPGLVIDGSGNIFGTAFAGGAFNAGTLFELPAGSSTLRTLANFAAIQGDPGAGPVEDSSGNLFGTVNPVFEDGAVYELPEGSSSITILETFNGLNGSVPSGLIEDSEGNLYGVTFVGGAANYGVVFEVPSGGTISVLASFSYSDGAYPESRLVEDISGNLFGVTSYGGASDDGTVFEVAAGSNAITTLVSFDGANGAYPRASLTEDSLGNLFGTTQFGGLGYTGGATGTGTLFEIEKGSGAITTLGSFSGSYGQELVGNAVLDPKGDLYGTTFEGGANGLGTLFEVLAALPTGTAGQPSYTQTFVGSGGTGSLTFSASGSLPPGLTLSPGGVLSGAPTAAGSFPFTVTATDSLGNSFSKSYTVIINPAVTISPALADGTVGMNYDQTISASGGTGTLTFSETGSLPPGITLGSSGVLSGKPTTAGSYTFTITAADSLGASGSQLLTLTISPPAVITLTPLP